MQCTVSMQCNLALGTRKLLSAQLTFSAQLSCIAQLASEAEKVIFFLKAKLIGPNLSDKIIHFFLIQAHKQVRKFNLCNRNVRKSNVCNKKGILK